MKLRYGNCLIGAVVLAFTHRFRGKFVVQRTDNTCLKEPNRSCVHFLYEVDQQQYHFRFKRDFLPYPISHLFFEGKFARHRKRVRNVEEIS